MRISDWSSDVCSSDLGYRGGAGTGHASTRREALRGPSLTGLGPFPIHVVIAAAAIVVGWLVVRAWARRLPVVPDAHPHRVAVGLFFDAVLLGLLAARLGYGLRWWPEYAAAPQSTTAKGRAASRRERGWQDVVVRVGAGP